MRADFDVVGSFSQERFTQLDCQRTLNLFQIMDPEGKKPKALYPTPGRKLLLTLPAGDNVRRLFTFKGFYYAVCGQDIYRIDDANNTVKLTSSIPLLTNTGHIGVDANQNNQIIFVDGTAGYLWDNNASTFTKITHANFPPFPSDVIFKDGRFIVNNRDTAGFYLSAINNGADWPGVFAQINSEPDTIVGFENLRTQLFIFGSLVTEVWENRGGIGMPFRLATSLGYGCISVDSIAQEHELLFWLAKTKDGVGSVMMTDGTAPAPISTREIDEAISGYSKSDDAVGYIYKDKGQIFYQLTFPTAHKTFLFNVNTRLWSECEDLGAKRHIGQCHTFFANKHIIGAYNSAKLYEQSVEFLDNDGEAIHRQRITKHFSDPTYNRIRINEIQLDFAAGLAPASGPDEEPQVFLGISTNGGVTFDQYLRANFSKIGQYNHRAIWRRLGTARSYVFKIDFYNAVNFCLLGGAIDCAVLPS